MNELDSSIPARKLNIVESNMFWFLKVFAILSVITAHISFIHGDGAMHWVTTVYASFSTEGVIWFFIMGGFFFSANGTWQNFIRKKKSMATAWLVCSLVTYIVCRVIVRKASVLGCIQWILGYFTWYYYVVIFLALQIIFFLLRKHFRNKYLLCGCCLTTIVSVMLESRYSYSLLVLHLPPYLNVFNWIGYFALGILLRSLNITDYLSRKSIFGGFVIGFLCILFLRVFYGPYGYFCFHIVSVFDGIFSFMAFLFVSKFLAEKFSYNPILDIGKETYCIYLLHMPIVQFTVKILPDSLLFVILNPLLCLLEMHILIVLSKMVCPVKYRSFIFPLVGLKADGGTKLKDPK